VMHDKHVVTPEIVDELVQNDMMPMLASVNGI